MRPAEATGRLLPSTSATRAHAVQRLQVGLSGLAAMLLLVALASLVIQQARKTERSNASPAAETASSAPTPANDPLVDIGVVPDLPSDPQAIRDLPAEDVPEPDDPLPPPQS